MLQIAVMTALTTSCRGPAPNEASSHLQPSQKLDSVEIPSKSDGEHRRAISDFWHFVAKNQNMFLNSKRPSDQFIESVGNRLFAIHTDLGYEYGQSELCITANGQPDLIPIVQEIVEAAPKDLKFKVCAFRQPIDLTDVRFNIDGHTIPAKDVRFVAQKRKNGYHVILFSPGVRDHKPGFEATNEAIIGKLFILLDNAIGELNVMTMIEEIEFFPVSKAPKGHRPLTELPALFGIKVKSKASVGQQN